MTSRTALGEVIIKLAKKRKIQSLNALAKTLRVDVSSLLGLLGLSGDQPSAPNKVTQDKYRRFLGRQYAFLLDKAIQARHERMSTIGRRSKTRPDSRSPSQDVPSLASNPLKALHVIARGLHRSGQALQASRTQFNDALSQFTTAAQHLQAAHADTAALLNRVSDRLSTLTASDMAQFVLRSPRTRKTVERMVRDQMANNIPNPIAAVPPKPTRPSGTAARRGKTRVRQQARGKGRSVTRRQRSRSAATA